MLLAALQSLRQRITARSSFLGGVITLFTASALAQIIPLAAAPFLTRLYSPDDFGVLALFLSVASLVGVVATARYELAVMLPDEEEDALHVVALALGVTVIVSVISMALLAVFGDGLVAWLRAPALRPWLVVVPLFVLVAGIQQTLVQWNTRLKRFGAVGGGTVSQSGGDAVVALSAGLARAGAAGLIAGVILGRTFAAMWLARELVSKLRQVRIQPARIGEMARRYSDFPGVNAAHAFADMAHRSLLHVSISVWFGPSALGLFSYAVRNARAPQTLVSGSVAQVFFQHASQARTQGRALAPLVSQTLRGVAPVAVGLLLALLLAGPFLFGLVFGDAWTIAGEYARRVSPMLFLGVLSSPISCLPIVLEKQHTAFVFGLVVQCAGLIAFLSMSWAGLDFVTCVSLYSAVMTVGLSAMLAWYVRIAGRAGGDA
ncbi:MAG: oligosaccharide flippase family protein [Verrucomicrobia bacterium]|nr:oligosaccharide flippase family protein [Verrucomicrobiota bacterium]MDA1085876.1 oligosaccharide flippase family protein [Verrucomicrobiota bacterium]